MTNATQPNELYPVTMHLSLLAAALCRALGDEGVEKILREAMMPTAEARALQILTTSKGQIAVQGTSADSRPEGPAANGSIQYGADFVSPVGWDRSTTTIARSDINPMGWGSSGKAACGCSWNTVDGLRVNTPCPNHASESFTLNPQPS